MNIVMIMSGGVGSRFGSMIPKQYNLLLGQPVIDYVIEAVQKSRSADRAVVVMDPQWMDYSEKLRNSGFDFAVNGDTRLGSVKSGLDYIHAHYACDKLLIVDAVAPFLYPELIDDYFEKLDRYDAVITAQKITGGFTNVHNEPLDREQYIVTQSPEAFRFEAFYACFDVNYPYQEMACMLPREARRYYNYDFRFNLKLTYDHELKYAEYMLGSMGRSLTDYNRVFFDKQVLYTTGLKNFLLRNEKQKTERWLDEVYSIFPEMIRRWEITSFLPNQISRYGLVIEAKSQKHGSVIIKLIPEFVGRYERELEAMRLLSPAFMCRLLDDWEEHRVMLLSKVEHPRYADFEENKKLIRFFAAVTENALPYTEKLNTRYTPRYEEELRGKLRDIEKAPFLREEIRHMLQEAVALFEGSFSDLPLYYIHGDLHALNILDDGNAFYGIDPNGFIAPLAFEYARFLRNDIKDHSGQFDCFERLNILLNTFGRFHDKAEAVKALLIDLAFTTYNSTFENETPDDALLNMRVADAARQWLSQNE